MRLFHDSVIVFHVVAAIVATILFAGGSLAWQLVERFQPKPWAGEQGNSTILLVVYIGFFVALIGVASYGGYLYHRAKKRAESMQFRFCPACEYSLVGLPDEGDCPECGSYYNLEKVQMTWKERWETSFEKKHWPITEETRPLIWSIWTVAAAFNVAILFVL